MKVAHIMRASKHYISSEFLKRKHIVEFLMFTFERCALDLIVDYFYCNRNENLPKCTRK